MYSFTNLEPVCCSMSGSNCCLLTCIQISLGAGKVFSIPISWRIFHSFFVVHTIKGFSVFSKAEVDVTNLENILKTKDITLPTRSLWSNLWFSELNMYRYKSWTLKNAFKLWCWRRLLKVPWTSRRSNQSILKISTLKIHLKDWCWSSNNFLTWCEGLTHWIRPWSWERLKAGGEWGDRGWDSYMASLTQWTCIWANSGTWWNTREPGVLQSMRSQRVRHDLVAEQQQMWSAYK